MLKGFVKTCLLAGSFSLTTFAATAQEVVHALAGTVTSIDPPAKTIQINTDDGSEGRFKDLTNSHVSLDFDKSIRADAIVADAFRKQGMHVIVYYFGDSEMRTAVALQGLGTGPFERSSGTIVKFNRHEHLLTIKNSAGVQESFHIARKTCAETAVGAVAGYKFDPEKGDQVRVIAAPRNGSETALFIRVS
jgi:hypothetical protein